MSQTTTETAAAPTAANKFIDDLFEHIRAGYQCVWVPTAEENRVEQAVIRMCEQREKPDGTKLHALSWDAWEGLQLMSSDARAKRDGLKLPSGKDTRDPAAMLDLLTTGNAIPKQAHVVIVLRDMDDFTSIDSPAIRRRLRSLIGHNRLANAETHVYLVVVTPRRAIHEKLQQLVTTVEFPLPDDRDIATCFDRIQAAMARTSPERAACSPELRDAVVNGLLGLTSLEAENCLARCTVRHGAFCEEMLDDIKAEKAAAVKRSETLTYIPEASVASRDQIGGFDNFLSWLDRRQLAYTKEARAVGLDQPRGVVLLGVPGTGKSLVGKAACRLLGLPGYILDIGSVFNSLVGQSEERMRRALQQVEAQQGAVLLIDEADKALGNAHESTGDSGVTRRVFGTLLTWLTEHTSRTFAIMTLNRVAGLPPELMRAGRFDAVFYTDLPSPAERRTIFDIHLRKRRAETALTNAEWSQLLAATEDFVGAEIEEVVRDSRYRSFELRRSGSPTFEDLLLAANNIRPMARTDEAGVKAIREMCHGRYEPVTNQRAELQLTRRRTRDVS